ncbi:MAG: chloride channel protein [Deltaproteobacteria bacterium]|nr:chloride channel protein [Deltaproteobacteria bacterium]
MPRGAPLDMQILGRTLLHAHLVGALAGLIGAGFFAGLEYVQQFLLEGLAGYVPLRASGEQIGHRAGENVFRPWLLVLLPAAGALVGGLFMRLAPETRGGGGDAMIDAFHHQGGVIRGRVIWVKALASMFTLGTGGSGGREGPTMQIGGALGSLVARVLKLSTRERRVLLVAGVAAGISAVFRTPLGAALLAIEVLYRDDFESEALIPAILASVISYSVVIAIFGESTLFARGERYPLHLAHLPLYGLLAIFVAFLSTVFLKALRAVQGLTSRFRVPFWIAPAAGGLCLGVLALLMITFVGGKVGMAERGLGILGGGYGAAEAAITGGAFIPSGWTGVELLLILCIAKVLASSLTIGTGGSAGDFAPSLVMGALLGGAFGRAAQLLSGDLTIQPGAFALVGMGTFYGGIAHAPVSSLIMVCELAGNYDLLVPLMLAEGIAFVALRKRSLYHAQVPSMRHSPAHRDASSGDVLADVRVGDILATKRPIVSFSPATPTKDILSRIPDDAEQEVFPVVDAAGKLKGLISPEALRFLATHREVEPFTVAADIMQPPITVRPGTDLRAAAKLMLENDLHQLPATDDLGQIVGFLDEDDIFGAYLSATGPPAQRGAVQ